jgi:galactonate dehydratase
MADAHYAQIAPHNPLGPIALAASLQVDCTCDNLLAQELIRDLGAGLIDNPFELKDGTIAAPTGPGLGISVNLEEVKARQHDGSWKSPSLSYSDGSVANW